MARAYEKLITSSDEAKFKPYEPFLHRHLARGIMGISVLLSVSGTAFGADSGQATPFSERLNRLRSAVSDFGDEAGPLPSKRADEAATSNLKVADFANFCNFPKMLCQNFGNFSNFKNVANEKKKCC